MVRFLFFLIGSFAAIAGTYAQSAAKKDNAGEVEVLFANGSLVRLTLVQEKIDVNTLYGKLSVPLADVRRIEFGVHVPEGVDAKVEAGIKQLASGDYKEREAAARALTALGAYAYAALLKAAKSTEPETAKRATDAIARIRARVPAKELRVGEDDRIVTSKFTIVGQIVTASIKARTEYFGDAQLTLPQLRQLRVLFEAKDAELSLDAAKYANTNEWLETNVTVDSTSILSIAASGQVDLCPQMPGTVICGPQGYGPGAMGGVNGPGGIGAGGIGGGPGGFPVQGAKGKKAGGVATARSYAGVLLGKIGENGETFIIGARFEGTPEHEGKLYLHINPSPYDSASTGTYRVKISSRN